jgi:acetyltransferase-like isoleucine patch superfamily enzyme
MRSALVAAGRYAEFAIASTVEGPWYGMPPTFRSAGAKNGPFENFAAPPVLTSHGINGIVIASGVIVGHNVTISHQVTIGRSRGVPIIGDNVYIGSGTKIFSGIRIGNNVNIGANCVVFQDIPDNATVVFQKPRIHRTRRASQLLRGFRG